MQDTHVHSVHAYLFGHVNDTTNHVVFANVNAEIMYVYVVMLTTTKIYKWRGRKL
jgi:hypothetical protein